MYPWFYVDHNNSTLCGMPHTVCDKMWLTIRSKYFLFISSISCVKRIITTRKLFLCSFSVYRYGNLSFFVITRAPVVLNGDRRWWNNRKIRISRKHHMISQSRDIWYIIWQDFHLFSYIPLWSTYVWILIFQPPHHSWRIWLFFDAKLKLLWIN